MGIIVNAQAGSIINNYDIQDNEVVNVGINGEVHETSEIREEDAQRELPYELNTPKVILKVILKDIFRQRILMFG